LPLLLAATATVGALSFAVPIRSERSPTLDNAPSYSTALLAFEDRAAHDKECGVYAWIVPLPKSFNAIAETFRANE